MALTLQALGRLMESCPEHFSGPSSGGRSHTVSASWLLGKCCETLEAGGALSVTAGVLLAGALDGTASALTQVPSSRYAYTLPVDTPNNCAVKLCRVEMLLISDLVTLCF